MNEYAVLIRTNRNFRLLWLGNVVSLAGDWFNLIASAQLIAELKGTGIAVSYLFLARFLPLFLFSPLAGVLADRYSRRGIMIITDLLRAMTVLGFLVVRSPDQVWILYVLTILQFALSALFTPARSAFLANIVAQEDLVTANALDSLTWSTMLAIGAFLGGVVAAVLGGKTAFVLDAVTYLASALLIRLIVAPRLKDGGIEQGGWLDFLDGLRYLKFDLFILGISLVKGAGSLIWGAINVLEVKFANEIFTAHHPFIQQYLHIQDSGAATLGMIYVVSGLGTGLGPLLMRRWLGDAPTRLLFGITIGFGLMAAGILGLGAAPTFTLLLLATLARTVGTGTLWVFSAALLQTVVPDRFRGRVFAFEFAVLTMTQSLSIFWAGSALDHFALPAQRVATLMGAAGLVVTGGWILFYLSHLPAVRQQAEEA
ncbi:MAG: MFS transporter [Anaerolineae bacterium]